MDDLRRHALVEKGKKAQRLLDDDLFKETAEQVRNKAIQVFIETNPNDVDALRHARIAYQNASEFEDVLKAMVNDGTMAAKD